MSPRSSGRRRRAALLLATAFWAVLLAYLWVHAAFWDDMLELL